MSKHNKIISGKLSTFATSSISRISKFGMDFHIGVIINCSSNTVLQAIANVSKKYMNEMDAGANVLNFSNN